MREVSAVQAGYCHFAAYAIKAKPGYHTVK
jgi:hypothetical protein